MSESESTQPAASRRPFRLLGSKERRVDLVIAESALKELGTKLSAFDVEKVRYYVAHNARKGVLDNPDVPILSLVVPKPIISKSVNVQYFVNTGNFRFRPDEVCIIAIDPEDLTLVPGERLPLSSDQSSSDVGGLVRSQTKAILGELYKQGITAGVKELVKWISGGS
jgi:hypothetical protein